LSGRLVTKQTTFGGGVTVGTVTAIELLAPTCLTTEQTGGINRTINPDAVIGHNLGPALDGPSVVPDNLAPSWSSPVVEELKWNDRWHLVYLNALKTGGGIVSKKLAAA
jgi:hypothetical protein